MGYHTDFTGEFEAEPAFTPEQVEYLEAFNHSRKLTWDEDEAAKMDDPLREAVGLPVGPDGAFIVAEHDNHYGQMAHKRPAYRGDGNAHTPGYWCQWVARNDGQTLEWDGGEKFYQYEQWLAFVIEHFCKPWGVTLNGTVHWYGEDRTDIGVLEVIDNDVFIHFGSVEFTERRKVTL